MPKHEPHEPHYDIHDGTGPYLLMVHGFLSSRAQWQHNLAALSQVSRPVVVELWGHGRSPSPDDPKRYHPDAYVAFFDALRQRLGAEQWMVCGQSLGAALTLRYAFTYPSRVMAQVFTNSNAGLADAEWITARRKGAWEQADAIDQDGREAVERIPVHPRNAKRLPAAVHQALLADTALLRPRALPAPCATPHLNRRCATGWARIGFPRSSSGVSANADLPLSVSLWKTRCRISKS